MPAGLPRDRLAARRGADDVTDDDAQRRERRLAGATDGEAPLSITSGQIAREGRRHGGRAHPERSGHPAWATVVGNRVNCTGVCWTFIDHAARHRDRGGGRHAEENITVPDGLGGWHAVQLVQGGNAMAQVPFFVKRSFAGQGVSRPSLHAGQHFTIHLKGLGWTQLDNTIAVDYDNAYIGYGCGFNCQGDTVLDMVASGEPGTHLIDMYPLIYTQQPSYANTPYGMIPMLCYAPICPGSPSATSCRRCAWRLRSSSRWSRSRGGGRAPSLSSRQRRACTPSLASRRQPPVPAAEDGHERRHEDSPHDGCVEHDGDREADAELPQALTRPIDEAQERATMIAAEAVTMRPVRSSPCATARGSSLRRRPAPRGCARP